MTHHPHLTDEQVECWKELKGNYTLTPNYLDLIKGIYNVITWYYGPMMWRNYTFPNSYINEIARYFYFPIHEVYYILYIAIFITLLRYAFERVICKVSSDKTKKDGLIHHHLSFSSHSSIGLN